MRIQALLAFALVAASASAAKPSTPTVAELSRQYLDALFVAKPHLATFMGDHRFDERLPDLSPAALARREQQLVSQRHLAEQLAKQTLPRDEKIDLEILTQGIDLELLYLRSIKDWTWDPRLEDSFPFYDPREIVASRLSDIVHGDFAPEAERRKSVVAQLAALPRFLDEKVAAMGGHAPWHVSSTHLAQAIKDNGGRIDFLKSEVAPFVKGDAAGARSLSAAVAALEKYQQTLKAIEAQPVRDNPYRDWRLGRVLYDRKFPLALQTNLPPDEAVKRARASFAEARAELLATSVKLHDALWPREPKLVGGKLDASAAVALIRRVNDELGKDHCKPAELVAAHAKNLDALRAFIEKHDLLSLPPRESLRVEPMPPFKRGSSAAEYLAPGILDRSQKDFHATYYIDPIDPSWPADKVESYLRGQNDYEVQLVAAHEAYPGHHTQFSYERKDLNPLRAVLWNGAMVEGWAVYGEGLMVRTGWGGAKNDAFRFTEAKGRMIVASNLILDVGLQRGELTDEQAVKFMVEEGFQERAQAEKKLLRAKLDSTQLAQYFLGLSEILELEADHKRKVGGAFRQRAFDEALIGHGSIAVRHLRTYLLGE